jgi:hypothetical protein
VPTRQPNIVFQPHRLDPNSHFFRGGLQGSNPTSTSTNIITCRALTRFTPQFQQQLDKSETQVNILTDTLSQLHELFFHINRRFVKSTVKHSHGRIKLIHEPRSCTNSRCATCATNKFTSPARTGTLSSLQEPNTWWSLDHAPVKPSGRNGETGFFAFTSGRGFKIPFPVRTRDELHLSTTPTTKRQFQPTNPAFQPY